MASAVELSHTKKESLWLMLNGWSWDKKMCVRKEQVKLGLYRRLKTLYNVTECQKCLHVKTHFCCFDIHLWPLDIENIHCSSGNKSGLRGSSSSEQHWQKKQTNKNLPFNPSSCFFSSTLNRSRHIWETLLLIVEWKKEDFKRRAGRYTIHAITWEIYGCCGC